MIFRCLNDRNLFYDDMGVFSELYLMNSKKKKVCTNILKTNKNHGTFFLKKTNIASESKLRDIATWLCRRPSKYDDRFVWPEDLVYIPPEISEDDMRFYLPLDTDINYSEREVVKRKTTQSGAIVFPYSDELGMENFSDVVTRLMKSKSLNYQNPEVMVYIKNILEIIDTLNKLGYIFNEFHVSDYHPSRFYVKNKSKIILDFSTLLTPVNGENGSANADILDGNYHDYENIYPLEFADPTITMYEIADTSKPKEMQMFTKNQAFSGLDQNSANYSLTAFLFFLMYGQMPYWGRVFSGLKDNDITSHYKLYRELYLSTPAFIFDKTDHIDNDMFEYGYGQSVIDLWENTREEIREMFLKTLSWNNALRLVKPENPSAEDWMRVLFDKSY